MQLLYIEYNFNLQYLSFINRMLSKLIKLLKFSNNLEIKLLMSILKSLKL
jgi:hypothetical protein